MLQPPNTLVSVLHPNRCFPCYNIRIRWFPCYIQIATLRATTSEFAGFRTTSKSLLSVLQHPNTLVSVLHPNRCFPCYNIRIPGFCATSKSLLSVLQHPNRWLPCYNIRIRWFLCYI
ncbi:hypothetical protein PoB_003219200 [Plakobranchus ocellatus]|uniref:Uncharacterized protein n=1 Tax=Plakobranchus ocellatus TaxID=259542 RepID=A0AAV4AF84_9GAST|nr:hypothetical protein PoB_003219200 [Plakobranchus ocellatus]